ncbi:MAG: glucosamine-6-phosphate deaminase [Verrucomicrobia bacterium]|nr:glucosamine-6-phosphate deaminase [Verrucomicrobiota bacterium]
MAKFDQDDRSDELHEIQMNVQIFPNAAAANLAAADSLARCLTRPETRTLMAAGGNTPLELYRLIAERSLPIGHLTVFALDEYVGVPEEDPRTCANLLRRVVADAWGIPPGQFHGISSHERDADENIRRHESRISALGGLDVIILGLGQNAHLGFNEPGSPPDALGRLVNLEPASVQANRAWFGGDYSPAQGVTAGLQTILSAKKVFILAYGRSKASAVRSMIEGSMTPQHPASFLQNHADVSVYLDEAAASELRASRAFLPS